jgi:hypothetical protein
MEQNHDLTASEPAEEFVMVPVPKSRVLDVMAFLAAPSGVISEPADLEGARVVDEPQRPDWDPESLRRLVLGAHPTQIAMLKLLAERSPEAVGANEVAAALPGLSGSYPGRAVGGVVKSLGQRCRRHHERRNLPFDSRWDHDVRHNQYEMDPAFAAAILEALPARERGLEESTGSA